MICERVVFSKSVNCGGVKDVLDEIIEGPPRANDGIIPTGGRDKEADGVFVELHKLIHLLRIQNVILINPVVFDLFIKMSADCGAPNPHSFNRSLSKRMRSTDFHF